MKRSLKWMAGSALLSVTLFSVAADRTAPPASDDKSQQRYQVNRHERLTAPVKATEITGKEVVNAKNEKLGKVEELGVDVEAGRVTLVVINSGGVLGVGGRTIAVPPRAFSYDAVGKTLRLDTDVDKLKAAPVFETSKWKEAVETNRVAEIFRYYGQEPYARDARDYPRDTRDTRDTREPRDARDVQRETRDLQRDIQRDTRSVGEVRMGRVEKSSRVIGLNVVNTENKKCGEVDNLIVDLPNGRLVYVVVSSGGVLGVGDTLNAVPPSSFRYTSDGDSLQISLTKEELAKGTGFKKTDWPDFGDPAYSGKVYRSYGVEPYFNTDADNTSRNVRDRDDATLTPLDQGRTEGDLLISRNIRKEILARDGLSVNARNVKVITINGRVTLRGPVKDAAERDAIAAIASRLAGGASVDNQLEVKREP